MKVTSIARRFRLLSFFWVLGFVALSKFLYIFYWITAADATIAVWLATICRYSAVLTEQAALAMAVVSVVYAVSFFGKKTAMLSALTSLLCFTAGEASLLLYNLIRNVLSRAAILAATFSLLIEILFAAILLLLAFFFGLHYAKRRFSAPNPKRLTRYAPLRAVFGALGTVFLLRLFDLTAFNVVPFFLEYSDITGSELRSILGDYAYYLIVYLLAACLLALLAMKILEKCTGALRPKDYFTSDQSSNPQ